MIPDQKDHYAVASITLVMDSTNEDYENYGTAEKLAERVSLIKNTIRKVFADYTVEQAKDPQYEEVICQAIRSMAVQIWPTRLFILFIVGTIANISTNNNAIFTTLSASDMIFKNLNRH